MSGTDSRAEPSEAAYLRDVECDDSNTDAASDQLSSRASDVSELSDVFETVDEQLVGPQANKQLAMEPLRVVWCFVVKLPSALQEKCPCGVRQTHHPKPPPGRSTQDGPRH
jgi:hypothetical protein